MNESGKNRKDNAKMPVLMKLVLLALQLGTVQQAHMYSHEFFVVQGVSGDGRGFSLTLSVDGKGCA